MKNKMGVIILYEGVLYLRNKIYLKNEFEIERRCRVKVFFKSLLSIFVYCIMCLSEVRRWLSGVYENVIFRKLLDIPLELIKFSFASFVLLFKAKGI